MRIRINARSPAWPTLAGALVALRLAGLVAWPWWAVLAPLWLPWAIEVAVGGAMFVAWFALYSAAMRRVDRYGRRAK